MSTKRRRSTQVSSSPRPSIMGLHEATLCRSNRVVAALSARLRQEAGRTHGADCFHARSTADPC
jgi:hypothetical protein